MLTQFVAAFDDIVIGRFNKNRNEQDRINVRYLYAPKQRVLQDIINELEAGLNVLVLPADINPKKNKVVIYPSSQPGGGKPYGPMAQRIVVSYNNEGEIELEAIVGYSRSFDRIGPIDGVEAGKTRYAGQKIWMASGGNPLVSIKTLKYYVEQLQRGLEGESQAQADFYKDRQPD